MRQVIADVNFCMKPSLGQASTGADCPQVLSSLHYWRFLRSNWTKIWAAWSDLIADPALSRRKDEKPALVLSNLNVLWFLWLRQFSLHQEQAHHNIFHTKCNSEFLVDICSKAFLFWNKISNRIDNCLMQKIRPQLLLKVNVKALHSVWMSPKGIVVSSTQLLAL